MINDELMESNDKRNSEIMDLTVPIKLGDSCPFLIKFYGAIHAEVTKKYFQNSSDLNFNNLQIVSSLIFGF